MQYNLYPYPIYQEGTILLSELLIDNLCTQGFHIIDNFLELSSYQSLYQIAHTMQTQGLFRHSKIGHDRTAQHNHSIRSDEICWIDEDDPEKAIQLFLKQMHRLATYLNQTLFLGLHEFETHFATYSPGSFYKKHCDQFATNKARKISCVYYLNPDWTENFGGELKLFNTEDQLIQTVFPQGNRFICFNSELPHEVCVTQHTRFSIAGWMKVKL